MNQDQMSRDPLGWVLHERDKAEAAGIDLVTSEVLFVITAQDVADIYTNFITENTDAPEDEPTWDQLSHEQQSALIKVAQQHIERASESFDYTNAIEEAILDYGLTRDEGSEQ